MFSFDRALPEEVCIPSSAIKELLLYLDKKEVPMHALLIMRRDKLVFEKYYPPYSADTLHRMFSISKTFTALAISLLADEGKINFDDPITDYFPEYVTKATHPWIKATTIRNMLMMRTCHDKTTYKVDMKSDWVESFFIVPPSHKPGTIFHYDTSAAHVLCALVEKTTGMSLLDYLKDRFLNYLDFSKDSYMVRDPFGVSIGGSGLMATPMDILKVLYVLDKNGKVTCSDNIERTLINPDFIKEATSNLSDSIMTGPIPSESQGYGMQIWQNEAGGYVLYGMGGQLAISIPEKELLIMTCADTQGMAGGNEIIYRGIYDCLLPAMEKDNKSDPQKEYAELMSTSATLAIAPPRLPGKDRQKPVPLYDNIKLDYRLDENRQHFSHMKVVLSPKENCSLIFSVDDNNNSDNTNIIKIDFGIGKMAEGNFPIYNNRYTAGAIWLRENVLYIRAHLIGECVGSVRFELYLEEKEITVFMRKIEETYFNEFDGHLHGVLS